MDECCKVDHDNGFQNVQGHDVAAKLVKVLKVVSIMRNAHK